MAKNDYDDMKIAPMMYARFTNEFGELDYTHQLSNAFEITVPLQAMQAEAGAKGMGVLVQFALVPLSWFYGDPEEVQAEGENTDEQQA